MSSNMLRASSSLSGSIRITIWHQPQESRASEEVNLIAMASNLLAMASHLTQRKDGVGNPLFYTPFFTERQSVGACVFQCFQKAIAFNKITFLYIDCVFFSYIYFC